MPQQFIGREIEVTVSGQIKAPASFRLDNREYAVAEILDSWPDHGFGRGPLQRKKWWQRHHRNYFRVKTTEGEIFELYYDRGTSLSHPELKKWFLTRKG